MPERVTLDVIDRPPAGVRRAFERLNGVRAQPPEGMRALLALGTAEFNNRPYPRPTLRRVAVLAAWEDGDDIDDRWSGAIGELAAGSREHWHVEAEVTRASFTAPWSGWTPESDGARPLDADEPALVLISGALRARYVPAFVRDGAKAVAHAWTQPGYLGGLAIASSALNTTSCSCWSSYGDARDYAFKAGAHADVMKRDRTRGHHSTEHFLRLRPLSERGTLRGSAPFSAVLDH
jgi:hypothetical protein